MRQINIIIDNEENAELLKKWLQHIDFVKKVDVVSPCWSLPGTPASDEEIKQMLSECMSSNEGVEANRFFDTL